MKIIGDAKLTKREHEVLPLLAKGMTRDEIAKKLFISEETVKMHIKNLYKKIKAKNRIDALIKTKMIWLMKKPDQGLHKKLGAFLYYQFTFAARNAWILSNESIRLAPTQPCPSVG